MPEIAVVPPMAPVPVGPVAKTAVTVTVGGVSLALVDLIASAVSSFGGELTPTSHDALLVILMAVLGWVTHSQVIREDRVAVHQWFLSRLGNRPGGTVATDPAPARSAADLLRQAALRQ